MALVRITPNIVLSDKGIRSIKMVEKEGRIGFDIEVRYITGQSEIIPSEEISMDELLSKLGRSPRQQGHADSP